MRTHFTGSRKNGGTLRLLVAITLLLMQAHLVPAEVCPAGTWTSPSGCIECTAGFYSPLANVSTCNICPDGTFSANNASSCQTCPVGRKCFAGSAADQQLLAVENATTSSSNTNPFDTVPMASQQFIDSVRFTLLYAVAASVLFIFLLSVAVQKLPCFSFCMCDDNTCWLTWARIDIMFSRAHRRPDGYAIVTKKSPLGGFFTLACVITIVALGVQLYFEYFVALNIVSDLTSDLPTWEPHGTFRLTVTAHGVGMTACGPNQPVNTVSYPSLNFASFSPTFQTPLNFPALPFIPVQNFAVGIVPVAFSQAAFPSAFTTSQRNPDWDVTPNGTYRVFSTLVDNSTCQATWECSNCRLLRPLTYLYFVSVGSSLVQYVDYAFQAPSLTQSESDDAAAAAETYASTPFSSQGRVVPAVSSRSSTAGVFSYSGSIDSSAFFTSGSEVPISLTPFSLFSQRAEFPAEQIAFLASSGIITPNPNSIVLNTSIITSPPPLKFGKTSGSTAVKFSISRNAYSIRKTIIAPKVQTVLVLLASQSLSILSAFAAVFWLFEFLFGWAPGIALDVMDVQQSSRTASAPVTKTSGHVQLVDFSSTPLPSSFAPHVESVTI